MSDEGAALPRPGARVRVAWSGCIKGGTVSSVSQFRDDRAVRLEVILDGGDDLPTDPLLLGTSCPEERDTVAVA